MTGLERAYRRNKRGLFLVAAPLRVEGIISERQPRHTVLRSAVRPRRRSQLPRPLNTQVPLAIPSLQSPPHTSVPPAFAVAGAWFFGIATCVGGSTTIRACRGSTYGFR
jgi:hypothetical protein